MSTTFANSIDSNPIYADRAENDKDGNRIDQTYAKSASLATVATTGAYSDLSGTPSIPTATSDLTNDSGFITLSDVPAQVQADWTESDSSDPSYIAHKPTLAAVATSGDYTDLSNTPSIPTATSDLTNDSGFITSSDIPAQVQSDWTESDTSDPAYIAHKPTLAAVATSGDYSDLSGTPTINNVPAVTSSDDNKVLKASYTGGVGSYSWETESGGSNYTAGEGIDITNDEISAKIGEGLEFGTGSRPVTITAQTIGSDDGDPDEICTYCMQPLNATLVSAIETNGITLTLGNFVDDDNVIQPWSYYGLQSYNNKMYPAICYVSYTTAATTGPLMVTGDRLVLSNTGLTFSAGNGTVPAGTQFDFNLNDINTNKSTINWSTIATYPSNYALCIFYEGYGNDTLAVSSGKITNNALYDIGTITMTETVSDAIVVSNPLPASTSSDANKVLKVNASGDPEWSTGGGGGGTQADWAEDDPLEPSYIENKPVPKTLVAGTGITITESSNELTVASTNQLYNAGTGLTLNNATFAVDTSVVATQNDLSGYATLNDIPTVDQTYDASSANAQSGVAVADAIGNLGTNLSAAQLLALKEALGIDETVLFTKSWNTSMWSSETLNESITNFERIRVSWTRGGTTEVDGDDSATVEYDVSTINNVQQVHSVIAYTSDGSTYQYFTKFKINGSSYSEQGATYYKFGASISGWGTSAVWAHPVKIVGINRIASN